MSAFPDPEETLEISPETVSALRETASSDFVLVDCREADELLLCEISGHVPLPLSQFPDVALAFANSDEPEKPVIVYCHHGMRSQHAALFLRQAGLKNSFSMSGGIDCWSREIDSNIPRY